MSKTINKNNIDLGAYYIKNSKIYSGRDFGKEVRRKENIDKLDMNDESYCFLFPDDIMYVADSFILGLLGKSYILLGEKKFLEKYSFKTMNEESKYNRYILSDFNRGLLYIKNYSSRIL